MNQQLLYLLTGLLGFIFHSLIKLKSLNDDAHAANLKFNWIRDYLVKDIFGIMASFMAPFVWLLLFGEIVAKYPAIKGFTLTSFFVMGGMGSYILQLVLGKARSSIRKVVDRKTNELDELKNEN